nr:hypothetical protein [Tanacetum cinerariifolium]
TFKATFHSQRISRRYGGQSTYYGGIAMCTHRGVCEGNCGPPILAEQFELKHSLINIMTSDQFFGLEKDNPHDHIRCALNPADQDSLNVAAGGNLLERRTQGVLRIIKNKSKVLNSQNKSVGSQVKSSDANFNSSFEIAKLTHAVNQQTSDVTTAMIAILKQFQATPPPASVKAVEEICVTCCGAHLYYQCLAAGGNTFLKLRDNIQGYVAAVAVTELHQLDTFYNALNPADEDSLNSTAGGNLLEKKIAKLTHAVNQHTSDVTTAMTDILKQFQATPPPASVKPLRKFVLLAVVLIRIISVSPPVTTHSQNLGIISKDTFQQPHLITIREDEREEETLTDPDLAEYTIKVLPPLV